MLDDEERMIARRVSLTQQIDRGSVVLSSRLAGAFLNVPRHPLVPVFYRRLGQDRFVPWRSTDGDVGDWLDAVYSDDSLITEVDGVHAEDADPAGLSGVPTSSSTAPSLMADMLDALDLHPGLDVFEAGTGTGYNAGLLCFLAGERHVVTVDHTKALTDKARERLRSVGFAPQVVHGDGVRSFPEGALFDRLIATASVRRVPGAWLRGLRAGGIAVVPIKGTLAGGMVVRLTKLGDGAAAGHVLHVPAAFMPLRSGADTPASAPTVLRDGVCEETALSGRVLDDWTFSFFAQLHMSSRVVRTQGTSGGGLHVTTLYDPSDGSVARVDDVPGGGATTTWVGARNLWRVVEDAHRLWIGLNRPRREWFRVEVTDGEQSVRYTAPDGRGYVWRL